MAASSPVCSNWLLRHKGLTQGRRDLVAWDLWAHSFHFGLEGSRCRSRAALPYLGAGNVADPAAIVLRADRLKSTMMNQDT